MKLFASTTAKDTDWTANLVDVHPNGFAQNIQDGLIRARYRDSVGQAAKPIEAGKVSYHSREYPSHIVLPVVPMIALKPSS
jgi:predicted acyl esterase